jgi:glycosyltransferase involved in cell wall biosynthesis
MSALNVLYTHPGAELYGSDRMALSSVRALIESGMRVTVVIPTHGPLAAALVDSGARVTIRDLPVLRKSAMRPLALLHLLASTPRALVSAYRLVKRTATDVVYVNTVTQPWIILAARLAKRPIIVHVRESESAVPDVVKRALSLPLFFASHVVCNSRSTAQYVKTYGPKLGEKLSVIYNGKDWSTYFRRPFNGIPAEPTIVFVGRLNPRKGPDLAIEALALLAQDGVKAKLILAGSVFAGYEWFEEQLHERAAELGLSSRCDFRGFVANVSEVLDEADIVVVPSTMEPFGTVAAEGMASMRPTIVSDVQGLVEIVPDESVGLVFPSGDARALADACLRLIQDPELAYRVAEAGRVSVVRRFSLETYARETVAVVTRAGQGRP